ncbi:MAG: hypothetical protein ACYTDU_03125 [Planctomycetota bacterium]|jgi:hypothetical protein
MKRHNAIPVLLAVVVGCATPQRTYYESERQFGAVVKYLVAQKRAGRISQADAEKLTLVINAGNAAFQNWHDEIVAALEEDRQPRVSSIVHGAAIDVLIELSAWYAKYKGR